jgi:sulfoxide reductase heme-binding subunit YedZ
VGGSVHLIWITSRAAGIAALVLASTSVAVGLTMSGAKSRGRDLRAIHETLSLTTLGAIGLHGMALLADPWLKPGVPGVLIPLQIGYRPLAVAAGVVAAYGLGALGLSYYARARLGPARWRKLHRWTALFWVLAVVHGFTAGSDAGSPWFIAAIALVAGPAAVLLILRVLSRRAPGPPACVDPPRPTAGLDERSPALSFAPSGRGAAW